MEGLNLHLGLQRWTPTQTRVKRSAYFLSFWPPKTRYGHTREIKYLNNSVRLDICFLETMHGREPVPHGMLKVNSLHPGQHSRSLVLTGLKF
jgi:hypothetical protein